MSSFHESGLLDHLSRSSNGLSKFLHDDLTACEEHSTATPAPLLPHQALNMRPPVPETVLQGGT